MTQADLEALQESTLQFQLWPQPPWRVTGRPPSADAQGAAVVSCSLLSVWAPVTHTWTRLLCEQSARCSCLTKISRHHVCPVTAAQQTGLGGNPASYPCPEQGPGFPDRCPKATGHRTGGPLRPQEKEGASALPTPQPANPHHDLIPPSGMWDCQLRRIQLLVTPLTTFAQNTD